MARSGTSVRFVSLEIVSIFKYRYVYSNKTRNEQSLQFMFEVYQRE